MSGSADEEQNVTVAIRLRPLNDREKAGNQGTIWRCVPSHNSVTQTTPEGNPLPDAKGSTFFTYDRIFDERSSTQEVYDGVARGLVNSVIRGLNSTIFAYGQTSSGKTFTMQGGDNTYDSPGIVQMATRDLFSRMEETRDRVFLMRASYLEIYQEDIRDLLVPDPTVSKLQVREDPRKGVYIDAHEEVLGDFDHVLRVLAHGEQRRHVGCTEMNSRSSRSHTIFRLVVESQQQYVPGIHASEEDVDPAVFVATLNLVDLAGSESVRHTGATGLRQKEGGNINRSLLTLSQVIQKLSQGGTSHVNYRDSKLTRILQPSLSGNASMAIICCATPAEGFLEETRSTFQFASRAKQIKTRAVVNEVLDDKAQLRRMSKELAALRQQHAEPAALQGKLETLEAEKAEQAAKIERLGNLIINIANRPAAVAGAAAAVTTAVNGDGMMHCVEDELHVDISPRTRRTKRSRETWCPGKGEFPILQVQGLGAAADRMSTLLEEDDADYRLKRRSGVSSHGSRFSCSTDNFSPVRLAPGSKSKPPCTPLSAGSRGVTTPTLMTPARARAELQVAEMRDRLASLQDERDMLAAEADKARAAAAHADKLEAEVEVLKESLQAAEAAAAAAADEVRSSEGETGRDGMSCDDGGSAEWIRKVEAIAAELKKAEEEREEMKAELDEFCEYTDKKDVELVELQERLAKAEQDLHHKEADLENIRISEERDEREHAQRIKELEARVIELEAAIEERDVAVPKSRDGPMEVVTGDEEKDGGVAPGTQEEQDSELSAIKRALEITQSELEAQKARAELARNENGEKLEELMQEMSAAEFQLVQEKDAAARAAREAADAVAAATEAAEAAAARESEATATLRAKLAALEAEREENEEEMAELRALNAEAAALLADNQDRRVMQMDGEAQTDALEGVTGGTSEEDAVAGMAERDRALVALQSRIEELEGSISQAESQRHELDARTREEREETEAALREAVAGQRRAEDALSLANQSQLEMRCRLEEAVQQVKEAETMRGEMEVAAEVLNSNKDNRIAMLIGRVSEIELEKEAAVQAQASSAALKEKTEAAAASTAEEASRMREELEALRADAEAKGTNIAELEDHVSCLKAAGEEQAELEAEVQSLRGVHQQMLSEKEEKEAQVEQLQGALDLAQVNNDAERQAHVEKQAELEAKFESLQEEHRLLLSATEERDTASEEKSAKVCELEAALAATQANHELIMQAHNEKQAELETGMESLEDEHKRLLSETEDKDANVGALEAALASAQANHEAIAQVHDEKQAAMEEAMQSLKDEHQRLLSATEDKDAEAGELKAALAAALSDLEAIVQARSEKQAELETGTQSLKDEHQRLLSDTQEKDAKVRELEAALATAQADHEAIAQAHGEMQVALEEGLQSSKGEHERLMLEAEEKDAKVRELEAVLATAQADHEAIAQAHETQTALEEGLQSLKDEHERLVSETEEKDAKVRELEAALATAQADHAAIAQAHETQAAWEEGLQSLKDEHERLMAETEEKDAKVRELEAALATAQADHAAIAQGHGEKKAELEEVLQSLKVEHQRLLSESKEKEAKLGELEEALAAALTDHEAAAHAHGDECTDLDTGLQSVQVELRRSLSETKEKEAKVGELEAALAAALTDHAAVAQAHLEKQAELETELQSLQDEHQRVLFQTDEKNAKVVELEAALATAQANLEAAARAHEKKQAELETGLQSLKGEHHRLLSETEEKDAKVGELEAAVATARVEHDAIAQAHNEERTALEEELQSLQGEHQCLLSEAEEKNAKVGELEAAVAAARTNHEAAVQAHAQLQEELSSRDTEHEARVQQLSEQLAASEEDAESARVELAGARAAAEQANAATANEVSQQLKTSLEELFASRAELETRKEEISRLLEQAETSASKIAELQSELEEKDEKLAGLEATVDSFDGRLAAATEEAAAAREAQMEESRETHEARESASAERIAALESQLEQAKIALEKEIADAVDAVRREGQAVIDERESHILRMEKEISASAAELEGARQSLSERDELTAGVAAKVEAELEVVRAQLAEANTNLASEEEVVAKLRQEVEQATAALDDARTAAAAAGQQADQAAAALEERKAAVEAVVEEQSVEISGLKEVLHANRGVQEDLALALDESESLSKEVLDLTDELMEKDEKLSKAEAAVAKLREELATATAQVGNANSSNPDGHSAEIAEAEVRRLKVELDQKRSEIDIAIKETDTVRAELKEMKALFNAAGQQADAAGADEETLRKRLSQLMCENGLLKGEKDRREALDASMKMESRSAAARAAGEVERLERELQAEKSRADRAAGVAAEGNNAKSALAAMEARLTDLRQECRELQEAAQRSLDRCADAESEADALRAKIAQLEASTSTSTDRSAIVALETRIDELEEDVRRADASRVDAEGEARHNANRAKRIQGEVEMLRSEYEIVSDEAAGLRGRVGAAMDGQESAERSLAEVREASKAMEEQLGHRLGIQEAEVEALRQELAAAQERADAAEQREEADAGGKTARLLEEMEGFMEEKLAAEARAQAMAAELSELRELVKNADERAAQEQGMLMQAAQQRMKAVEEEKAAKDLALDELRASLEAARESAKTSAADAAALAEKVDAAERRIESLSREVSEAKAAAAGGAASMNDFNAVVQEFKGERLRIAEQKVDLLREMLRAIDSAADEDGNLSEDLVVLQGEIAGVLPAGGGWASSGAGGGATAAAAATLEAKVVSALREELEAKAALIVKRNARIDRLEEVKLTVDQVKKLSKMKADGKAAAAENKVLKKKLADMQAAASAGAIGGGGSSADIAAARAEATSAKERVEELTSVKETLLQKVRGYGAHINALETEQNRVRAVVANAGFALPGDGRGADSSASLSEIVFEVLERAAGTIGDESFVSTSTNGDGAAAAAAAAVAVGERRDAELEESREALQRAEADKITLQDQMRAGVTKYRALQAEETSLRERLAAAEQEASKNKEALEEAAQREAAQKGKSGELAILEKENLQLYYENKDLAKQLKALQEELQAAVSQRNRNTPKRPPLTPKTDNQPPSQAHTSPAVKPVVPAAASAGRRGGEKVVMTAAERRRQSVALLHGAPAAEEEAGECNQS